MRSLQTTREACWIHRTSPGDSTKKVYGTCRSIVSFPQKQSVVKVDGSEIWRSPKKMVNYPIIWHGFIHVNGGFSQKSSINSMESDVFNSRPCRESPLDRRWRRSTANLQCTVAANATIFRVFFKRMKPLNDIVAVPKICPKLIKTALNYYINSSFWLDP